MCSACHRRKKEKWAEAEPLYESCSNCHAEVSEYVPLFGDERTLRLSLVFSGVEGNTTFVEKFFYREFEESNFLIATKPDAKISAGFKFSIKEVFDKGLYPPDDRPRLFAGTCRIAVSLKSGKKFEKEIRSKVFSTTEPADTKKKILVYLMANAYLEAAGFLEGKLD